MTENTQVENQEVAVKNANPNIIRGRMPVAVVHQIRFGNDKNDASKVLAAKYGTTVGKIDDIKKGRNFSYITQEFKPTQSQLDDGLEWLTRHPQYNTGNVDTIINELSNTVVATAEEAAEFETKRRLAGGQKHVNAEGEVVNGGGGNRRKNKKAVENQETEVAKDVSGDDLLA